MSEAALAAGIPTATNVDHVAWTVRDLDESVRFFVDVLGAEVILQAGPFADPEGSWMSDHFDVEPRASGTLALLRLGPTQVVELLQWTAAGQDTDWPFNSDVGATHIAFRVSDLDAALDHLTSHGCTPCGDRVLLEDVPHAGLTIIYVRTPIDLYLELVLPPAEAMPYEATTSARLLPASAGWAERP